MQKVNDGACVEKMHFNVMMIMIINQMARGVYLKATGCL